MSWKRETVQKRFMAKVAAVLGLAALHLHCCPPKRGHLARMGWA